MRLVYLGYFLHPTLVNYEQLHESALVYSDSDFPLYSHMIFPSFLLYPTQFLIHSEPVLFHFLHFC
jgi:hypothetical protein